MLKFLKPEFLWKNVIWRIIWPPGLTEIFWNLFTKQHGTQNRTPRVQLADLSDVRAVWEIKRGRLTDRRTEQGDSNIPKLFVLKSAGILKVFSVQWSLWKRVLLTHILYSQFRNYLHFKKTNKHTKSNRWSTFFQFLKYVIITFLL